MRTFSALKGLSVFLIKSVEEIGKVLDLAIHDNKIIGVIIDKKGWLNHHLYLPIWDIHSFGVDALMIENHDKLSQLSKQDYLFASGKQRIRGKALLTTEGEKLGIVEDVYFEEDSGKIVGYEVTDGLIADIKEGKRLIKTNTPLKIGEDVLVIDLSS